MSRESRSFGDDHEVDVDDLPARRRDARHDVAQQRHAGGALVGRVGVGEQGADVAQAGGTQDGVDHGVRRHVGVGVAGEAELVVDGKTAEHEAPIRREPVGVEADADPRRQPRSPTKAGRRRAAGRPAW